MNKIRLHLDIPEETIKFARHINDKAYKEVLMKWLEDSYLKAKEERDKRIAEYDNEREHRDMR